jgi:hypothetical protein
VTRAPVLALVLGAGCGGGARHWIDSKCELSIAPRRDAVAFHDDDAKKLVLRREDGDHDAAYPPCVGDGTRIQGVVALADGWRALVWSYDVSGGNGFEHGEIADESACVVDFRTGATTDVDPRSLSRDLRHFEPTSGATTGWIYNREIAAPVQVIDLAGSRGALLELAGKAIVEVGTIARTVVNEIVDVGGVYKSTLVVQDYDTTTWPPAPREPRRIPVAGRTDAVAISADGRWAAYAGGLLGDVYDLGLVDLESGAIAFEALGEPGDVRVGDLVASGDAVWLLVATSPPAPRERRYTVQWLDRNGTAAGGTRELRDDFPPQLAWLPGRHRVASGAYCSVELHDLPPPVK